MPDALLCKLVMSALLDTISDDVVVVSLADLIGVLETEEEAEEDVSRILVAKKILIVDSETLEILELG